MISQYRLGPLLWAAGLLIAGVLLLLFNYDLLAAGEPVMRLVLASLLGAAAAGFFLSYFSARHEWARLIPAWTLLALAAMVITSSINTLDQRLTAAVLFLGLALAFANIYLLDRATRWWAVIPGGFMLVLGSVIALSGTVSRLETLGGFLFVGLGLVFFLVYWLGQRRQSWWALVPGAVLTVFGLAVFTSGGETTGVTWRWWPLFLIIAGLWVAVGAVRRGTDERLEVNTSPSRRKRAAAESDGAVGKEEDAPGQLGDYSRPAPGATIDILPDPEGGER